MSRHADHPCVVCGVTPAPWGFAALRDGMTPAARVAAARFYCSEHRGEGNCKGECPPEPMRGIDRRRRSEPKADGAAGLSPGGGEDGRGIPGNAGQGSLL